MWHGNGVIRRDGRVINRNYNRIIPFFDGYTLKPKDGEIDLELFLEDRPLPCGIVI